MKFNANLIVAVFMGATMSISIIGFAFLQGGTQPAETPEELPKDYIIDYALTQQQRQTLVVNYGKTLIEFIYDPQNCTSCGQIVPQLESLAAQFSDQVILSEIKSSKSEFVDLPRLFMTSQVGVWSKKGGNVSAADLEKGFCAVVLYPPLDCTIKPRVNANNSQPANSPQSANNS